MLHKAKKIVLIFCVVMFGMSSGGCSPNVNVSEIYQETAWISLDVSAEQQEQIDKIIIEAAKQVKYIQKNQSIDDLYSFTDLYKLANYLTQINDVREDTNSKIMHVLTPEQRDIFDNQLEKTKGITEKTTAMLLQLDLSESQQTAVVNSLLNCQKRVWSVISDTSLSWEKRRGKLKSINTLVLLESQLTKQQVAEMSKWTKSLNFY